MMVKQVMDKRVLGDNDSWVQYIQELYRKARERSIIRRQCNDTARWTGEQWTGEKLHQDIHLVYENGSPRLIHY